MGTRSLTVFKDGKSEIVVMYRQMDGYPSEHGKDLANFFKNIHMVCGLVWGDERKVANGIGCLAAQVVAHFKEGPGDFYLHKARTRNIGEEYIYIITGKNGEQPVMEIFTDVYEKKPRQIFKGTGQQFLDNFDEIVKENQE